MTGGAGFLGSHMCDRMIESREYELILSVDNLLTGAKDNLNSALKYNSFKLITSDICQQIDPVAIDFTVDEIWNFACPASPPMYQKDPLHTFKTSVFGVFNLIELADKHGAKLFHTSTSEVYGDPLISPQKETYWGNVNPVGLRSCYDEGKRAAETILFDSQRTLGVDCRVVRIFNTYGPRMAVDDGRVVSNFVVQALKGEDITVYGDGQQTRSFCFVDDMIEAFWSFMSLDKSDVSLINVGNPSEYTVLELAEKIIEKTKTNSKIVFQNLPEDDPKQRCPDIDLAHSLLGWRPTTPLEEGLDQTIAYFRKALGS